MNDTRRMAESSNTESVHENVKKPIIIGIWKWIEHDVVFFVCG
jgi:hypothetical protein